MKYYLFTSILVLFFSCCFAQDFDKEKMDKLFSLLDEHEQSMGCFSIFQGGKEVYTNAIGFADLATKKKVDTNTVYRVGSVSKVFTASIIMKLVEQKKLKLSSPLTRWFPKIKNSSRITIERLLNHSSGIYNFTNTDEYLNYLDKTLTREELYSKIEEFGSAFEPGEDAAYSNSNYVLLSMIAEKVTKKTFNELLQEMICTPLGLQRTTVGGKIQTSNNEAHSFKKVKVWEAETETDMSIPLGAGAIVSTASDINIFLYALFHDKVVSADSRIKMMAIQNGFGYGLFKIAYDNMAAYGHNGGIDGFQSMAYHLPKDDLTVTYLSNGTVYPINSIILDALGIYYQKGNALPEFLPVMKLKSEDLDQYLGKYTSSKIPIDLIISKDGDNLSAQATGQQAFVLDAIDIHKFKFDPARIKIEFLPTEKSLILNQNGKEYKMERE
jgi:CubicO group peptidase (beta-lactamase class C family)